MLTKITSMFCVKVSHISQQPLIRKHSHFGLGYLGGSDDTGLTLTYFTARSNLVPYAFVREKGKIMYFSETIVVYIKVGRFSQLNEYINRYEYQRSRSFNDLRPSSKVTQIHHFRTSFAQKP